MGTAMGKRYAPGLANLFLLEFDEKAQMGFRIKPENYGRFLDDIFFIWSDTLENLKQFNEYLNSLMPNIKVTLVINQDRVDFLDTTIFKHVQDNQTTLQTKVYFKETDTHQLLHKTSFHPKHTYKGVLKSQILRFKRICSFKEDFEQACRILFKALEKRNYSRSLMRKLKRDIWNNYKQPPKKHIKATAPIPINSTPASNVSTHSLIDSAPSSPLPLTNTQPPRPLSTSVPACRTECKTCLMIPSTTTFKSTSNNTEYTRRIDLTCKTRNIIYLITCLKCKLQYVGETGRTLNERMIDHRSSIKCNRATAVGIHFNEADHDVTCVSVIPLEVVTHPANRKEREQWYQSLLGTKHPFGLNSLPTTNTWNTTHNKTTTTNQILPIVLQYSQTSCKLLQTWKTIVRKNQLYKDTKLISAFSNDTNLQKRLVRSKFW